MFLYLFFLFFVFEHSIHLYLLQKLIPIEIRLHILFKSLYSANKLQPFKLGWS